MSQNNCGKNIKFDDDAPRTWNMGSITRHNVMGLIVDGLYLIAVTKFIMISPDDALLENKPYPAIYHKSNFYPYIRLGTLKPEVHETE